MNVKEAVQKVIDFTDDMLDEMQGKEVKFYQALAEHFEEAVELAETEPDDDSDEDEEE